MPLEGLIAIADGVLLASCLFILLGSVFITFKLKFVQFRVFPALVKMLTQSIRSRKNEETLHTIPPHRALFTAMSTTLGISTIVGPVIAIHLGGPGALLGFLLTSFFGSAATYAEVKLSIKHRQKLPTGEVQGGPMQYLKFIFSPAAAKWYAICSFVLMTAWSGAQANQLAAILDSPLLGDYRIPTLVSGAVLAVLVIITLCGGIKRIGAFSAKLVPTMFLLYLGSCLWIIFSNIHQFQTVCSQIFSAFLSPYSMISGTLVGGVVSALRWGVFKGIQASEAGIGTQAIPHSMAETDNAENQGILAMFSTYTAGIVAFISGCVALMTGTWEDPNLPLGITMVAESFRLYFSTVGIAIVAVSAILFAFGTILGNSFNGSQCYSYLTDRKRIYYYYAATAFMIFLGAISDVKIVWFVIDLILAAMALPHMAALIIHTHQESKVDVELEPTL